MGLLEDIFGGGSNKKNPGITGEPNPPARKKSTVFVNGKQKKEKNSTFKKQSDFSNKSNLSTSGDAVVPGHPQYKNNSKAGGSVPDIKGALGLDKFNINQNPAYQNPILALLPALQARALGGGRSLAQEQSRNLLLRNLASQQSGIRSYGGVSPALKQRMIADAAAKAGSNIAQKGTEAEIAERLGAQKILASTALGAQDVEAKREGIKSGAFESKEARKQEFIKSLGEGVAGYAKYS